MLLTTYGSSAKVSHPPKLAALQISVSPSKNFNAEDPSFNVNDIRPECPEDCLRARSCCACDFNPG